MSDVLSAAAAALGVPEALVQRAAAARATETGMSVDDVLSAWAGGGEVTAPPQAEPPDAPAEVAVEGPAEEPETEAPAEPPAPAAPEPAATPEAAAAVTPAAAPTEVTLREAAHLPEVVTVPTAGIRERTASSIPRWLTALMVAVPLVALFALGGGATGQCGSGTELAVDVVTGEIVDCDGSEFTGREPGGGGGTDFVALGEQIYSGGAISGIQCAGCHGAQGQGTAVFPSLTGVLTTFSRCADHLEWVALGSAGFNAAGRPTYGDTGKPVTQGMPGFATTLSEEQLAAVVAFERVRFGGADRETVLTDCGLAEPADGEGDDVSDGEDAEAILRRPTS